MNYKRIYEQLIASRIGSTPDGYYERHHIIPSCIGGTDDKANIVSLTAREHYIAHWLLWKIHRVAPLAHAFWSMARTSDNQSRVISSRAYASARNAHISVLREKKGDKNHFFGKKHSEETKRVISEKAKSRGSAAWDARSDESKLRFIAAASAKKTKEHRAKIGRPGLKMLQNIYTGEIVRVPKDFIEGDEWVNPRKLKPEKEYKCEHCEMVTTMSMLTRWHNDNCKRKP